VKLHRIKFWLSLTAKFLVGQGVIQVINLSIGLFLLRLLSVEEFALYSLAGGMLSLASLGTNLGVTSAFITLGTQVKDDPLQLRRLFYTIKKYRTLLFVIITCLLLIITPYITLDRGWSLTAIGLSVSLVILSNWVQLTQSLRTCVLNIHHDVGGLWLSGFASSVARLALTALFCAFIPLAVVALVINLLGLAISEVFLKRRTKRYLAETVPPEPDSDQQMGDAVKRFTYPLIPGVIYYAFRGQISLILLGIFGSTTSIANFGALGRLGQVLGLVGLLNGFVIQPYFARVPSRKSFIRKSSIVIGSYMLFALLLLGSAFVMPNVWLLIIGPNYSGLSTLLPLTFSIPILALFGDLLYVLLMSRGWTKGQNWTICLSVGVQIIFISLIVVNTTRDALILSLLSSISIVLVQATLLLKNIFNTKRDWIRMLQPQN
jgi:O-antigen/teichoic acid export membrane protein